MKTVELTSYLTRKISVLHFLSLNVIFDVLLVVFWQPIELLRYTNQEPLINPLVLLTITVSVGFLTLVLSRLLILYWGRKQLSAAGCIIWLLAELIVCVANMTLTLWLATGRGELELAPIAGDLTLGVLSIELLPYVISYLLFLLHESQEEVEHLRALLPQDTIGEVVTADHSLNFYEKGGRLAFATGRANVLYIEAANNYTNIHYLNDGKEDTFILHNTMKELENKLAVGGLVRCHRSFMVNLENVKLIRKDGMGMLLEMTGTTKVIPVTKTYARTFSNMLQNIGS